MKNQEILKLERNVEEMEIELQRLRMENQELKELLD